MNISSWNPWAVLKAKFDLWRACADAHWVHWDSCMHIQGLNLALRLCNTIRNAWIFMDMGCTSECTEWINTSPLPSPLNRGFYGWEVRCVCLDGSWWQPVNSAGARLQWASARLCWWAAVQLEENGQQKCIVLGTEISCQELIIKTTGLNLARVGQFVWLEGLLPGLCLSREDCRYTWHIRATV